MVLPGVGGNLGHAMSAPGGCLAGLSSLLCCGGGKGAPEAASASSDGATESVAEVLRRIVQEVVHSEVESAVGGIEASVSQEMQAIMNRLKKVPRDQADVDGDSFRIDRARSRRKSLPATHAFPIPPDLGISSAASVLSRRSTDSDVAEFHATRSLQPADLDHYRHRSAPEGLSMARCESGATTPYFSEARTPNTEHDTCYDSNPETDVTCDGTLLQDAIESHDSDSKVGTIFEIPERQRRRSSNWRIHSMDLGEKKAIARKPSDSGVSVIAIVQSERERWLQEKEALELRLSELKARQENEAKPRLDEEKQELKKQLADLRKAVAERSRFGAWVCERHLHESDDEDDDVEMGKKETLRKQLEGLEAKLRSVRAKHGLKQSWSKSRRRPSTFSNADDIEPIAPFKAGSYNSPSCSD